MTLKQWAEKHTGTIERSNGTAYVFIHLHLQGEPYRELFRLSDFKVSTVSGPVVWLVGISS